MTEAEGRRWRHGDGPVVFEFGVDAQAKALEDVAPPLSSYSEHGNQPTVAPGQQEPPAEQRRPDTTRATKIGSTEFA